MSSPRPPNIVSLPERTYFRKEKESKKAFHLELMVLSHQPQNTKSLQCKLSFVTDNWWILPALPKIKSSPSSPYITSLPVVPTMHSSKLKPVSEHMRSFSKGASIETITQYNKAFWLVPSTLDQTCINLSSTRTLWAWRKSAPIRVGIKLFFSSQIFRLVRDYVYTYTGACTLRAKHSPKVTYISS